MQAYGQSTIAPLPQRDSGRLENKPGRKPNIVFIIADDMGYGDLGAINFGVSETPNLDALMREGTFLSQCYAGSAVCAPSRASVMTGRYPTRSGVCETRPTTGLVNMALRERTVAEMLANAGYATGMFGKWHLGRGEGYAPYDRGFQEAEEMRKADHWDWQLDCNGKIKTADGRYLADVLTDDAIDFVQRHQEEPFFLYLAHFAPHAPHQAPEEDIQVFRNKGLSENLSKLYGMIRRMDTGIGRLLEELKRLGLEDDTLVIFTSDNGPIFGTSWTDRTSITRYNCGFNGHKDLVYEGGVRVPTILRWPNGLPAEQTLHHMMHFNDWLPTLLDVAGAAHADGQPLDGQSILPMLRGDTNQMQPRSFCWHFNRYWPTANQNAAIRDDHWKLVRPSFNGVKGAVQGVLQEHGGVAQRTPNSVRAEPYIPDVPPSTPQLFDLNVDPQELNDLSAKHPDRTQRMAAQLDHWFENIMTDLQKAKPELFA